MKRQSRCLALLASTLLIFALMGQHSQRKRR